MSAAIALLGSTAAPSPTDSTLSPAERFHSSLRGLAIGAALFLLAALAALFFTAAVFGYSVGALL